MYRAANGADTKTLEKLLGEEKRKNPKRIPYFFSACKKTPGKFTLAYQPGNKPVIEYFSLTPDGYRYRSKVHSSVNALVSWFKSHYRDPIPRPIPTTSQSMGPPQSQYLTAQQHSGLSSPSPMSSHGSRVGSTPYTPQWPSSTPPPPHYGGHQAQASFSHPPQQYGGYAGGYQQYHGGGGGGGGGAHYGQGGGHYQGGYQHRGGWGAQPSWTPAQSFSRTPGQTPGRTPAYTPTQTPGSFMGSMTGTPQSSHGHHKHPPSSPIGTPLLDE